MGDARQLSRLASRPESVLAFQMEPLPEPPPEALKLPGMRAWYEQLKLMRERDTQAINRLVRFIENA